MAPIGTSLHDRLGPLLVANRGEIAVRILRTAHDLGLDTVAVYSDADSAAPHVRLAGRAERIASYLNPGELLRAAAEAGARAVHPGYGFLSENAAFAAAVGEAGLTWIGPPPDAIELMGDKGRAKELAREVGVPVVPGTAGSDADPDAIAAFGDEHGFPLIVKALAGGGGRGMRVVGDEAGLGDAIEAAAREAEAAFGDRRLLAERYLERPRHIEVQVLADEHEGVVHLGERECSLQRRHQKVIEEAPSPVVDAALRERMGEAALGLTRACGYRGAGTVELVVPSDGRESAPGEFYFLEMNTRLQVEHPVTELVWGVDLVEQQLRIAAGEPLDLGAEERAPRGHAIEARLYAEDPGAGFLPAAGRIRRWRAPRGAGVRIDAGVDEGVVVGTDYDPLLAKLIAHGPDRGTAIARLDRALAGLEVLGVATSAAFSRALLAEPDVRAGRLDTGLLERALEELELAPPPDLLWAAAVTRYLSDTEGLGVGPGPWRRRFERRGEIRIEGGRLSCEGAEVGFRVLARGEGELLLELDGTARRYATAMEGETIWVARDGHHLEARAEPKTRSGTPAPEGSLEAPMPGRVLSVEVANGDRVEEGELLMILESMKMELRITAPRAGIVEGLGLQPGAPVSVGEALVSVAEAEAEE